MKKDTNHITTHYPLEWLDLIITVTLNPSRTDVSAISAEQVQCVLSKLDGEVSHLKSHLKNKVFSLSKQNRIRLLIRHYHSTLIILLDHVMENGSHPLFQRKDLHALHLKAVSCLDELLSFIEVRFSIYLSMEDRVPATYLSIVRAELKEQLEVIKKKVIPSIGEKYLLDIAVSCIDNFTAGISHDDLPVTFRDVLYHRELLKSLQQLEESDRISTCYTLLEDVLICLGFNHRPFIISFTQKTADRINMQAEVKGKIHLLALYQKELKQLIAQPDRRYFNEQPSLHDTLNNWFSQELFYLEKKLHLEIAPIDSNKDAADKRRNNYKILCSLSEDQIGIVLKAADDLRIIISRSLSNIFNQIVPYLSTPYREDLSANSMRSHTYSIEEKDKQIVIETLELMIEKIKEY